jgi:Ca-activated chloride channel family protein
VPPIADPEVLQRVRDELGPIPLTGVAVEARVAGSLAEVTVEQTFENNLAQRIEAVYVFPLPDDAAVHEMVMIIGERRISADLRERAEARQAYEQARAAGQTASLLEQERPNIFTMSVANIQPGEPARVLVRYVEELSYPDGRYHFHFPTTVGPRFAPGEPAGQQGTGMLADTTRVPDASRITPAVLVGDPGELGDMTQHGGTGFFLRFGPRFFFGRG